jgi:acyl-CoA reductase-like NAD-dependent aldehyde dehydrogenase
VRHDAGALALMNDSAYALTASIWTADEPKFLELEGDVEAGTVFLNRCDVLDPALAWTGAKESGRGVSLSKFGACGARGSGGARLLMACAGYDQLTRAKSVHMKIVTS